MSSPDPMLQAILDNPEQRAEMMKLLSVGKRGRISNRDKVLSEMKKLSEMYPKVTRANFKKIAQEAWDDVHPDGVIKKDTKPGSWQAFVQEKMDELKESIPDNSKRFTECARLWKANKASTSANQGEETADEDQPFQDQALEQEGQNNSSDWEEATEQKQDQPEKDSGEPREPREQEPEPREQEQNMSEDGEDEQVIKDYNEALQKIPCQVCKDPDDSKDEMLLCDKPGCDKGSHVSCAGLQKVPSGKWYCNDCKSSRKRKI